jgi:hypothetical protein
MVAGADPAAGIYHSYRPILISQRKVKDEKDDGNLTPARVSAVEKKT